MNAERVLCGDAEKVEGGRGSVRAKGSTRREGAAPSAPVAGGGAHGGAPSHNFASGLTSHTPWPKVKLSEVAKGIYDGPHATPPPCDTPGYYFLGIPQITPTGHIDLANPRYISKDDYAKWTRRVVPREGDVIFSYEATLNLYAIIPKDMRCCLGRRMGLVRPDIAKLDFRFLYYYFFSPEWRRTVVENTVTGATVDRLPIKTFPSFQMSLPPLPVQRRIADILSAYDDLIENNRRRIAILEETARLAFQTSIVEGAWESKPVTALIDVNPEVPKPKCGNVRYVPMSALSTTGMTVDLTDSEMRAESTSVRFVNGDVLLARITPCLENGKTAYVNFLEDGEIGCGSSEFIVLRGKRVSSYFTYCLSRLEAFRGIAIKSMVGASGRQRVQLSCFSDISIQFPDKATLKEFDTTVEPMFKQISVLSKQNAALAAARDMLLPRLMKGGVA